VGRGHQLPTPHPLSACSASTLALDLLVPLCTKLVPPRFLYAGYGPGFSGGAKKCKQCVLRSTIIDRSSSWLSTVITQSAASIDHTVDNSFRNGRSHFG